MRDRSLAGYDVPPIPLGSFSLRPTVNANATYSDNVLARRNDRRGDVFVRLSPAVTANSNWSTSLLSFSAAADIDRYASLTSENSINLNTSAYATHDLGENGRVRGIARYQTTRESREAEDVFVETRRPVRFSTASGGLGASRKLANTLLSVEGGVERVDFDDAVVRGTRTPVDEDFRDNTLWQARARAEFGQSPALAYFVQGTYKDRDYRQRGTDPLASARNSHIFELLAGARFELPILARGEIGVGYTRGTYRAARLNSLSGVAIRTRVTFFPTQLTNVIVTAERQVLDTGLPGSGGYTNLAGGIQVDHELLRTLILSAGARYERDRFNGIDRLDRRFQVRAGADYRLNRFLTARASVEHVDLNSHGANRYKTFVTNRVLVGVGLRV